MGTIQMIWLLFAHYIGDIALQNDALKSKGKYWYLMFSHCMIWTGCVSIALEYLGLFATWKVIFLLLGHWISDKIKSKQPKTPECWWMIYPDQIWHILQLCAVYFL